MKNILYLTLLTLLIACNKSDSNMSGNPDNGGGNQTGQGGSLARFAIAANTLYAVTQDELMVFDISTNSNPLFQNKSRIGVNIETIFPRDNNTLFIGSTNGMYIYDITNKQNPRLLSFYNHITACDPVVANDKFAYVTLRSERTNSRCNRGLNQLEVINIAELTNPRIIKAYPLTGPKGLGLWNTDLFVCDDGKLLRYNAKQADNLTIKQTIDIDVNDLIPFGNTLICVGKDGIKQYKIYNDSLVYLSSIHTNAN
ncbi:MAG: hypothetical protein ACK4K9_06795 [Bacteroidia bacterium]